jgi:hypothetical protein
MIDKFIYKCFEALDKVCEWLDNIFYTRRKKKK